MELLDLEDSFRREFGTLNIAVGDEVHEASPLLPRSARAPTPTEEETGRVSLEASSMDR